jgi:hypothetical protein
MTPFAIVGSQRSGTTYLRRSLNNHPDIVCHGEPFNPDSEGALVPPARWADLPGKDAREADPIAFLDRLMSFQAGGVVGFKLLLAHSPAVLNEIAARGYRLIILRRENALARYSSRQILATMQDSGQIPPPSTNKGPSAIKATFDVTAFEQFNESDRARWIAFENILDRHQPPRFELEYDELGWGDGRERSLDFLGVERRPLRAWMDKLNSPDVVSRFSNPEVVRDYLRVRGLTRWEHEGPPGEC